MTFENLFVTVGTTEFDKLINAIIHDDTVKELKKIGCKHLKVQIGRGNVVPSIDDCDISLEYYRYKDSLIEDIMSADLVISHAGAGTSMDVLEAGKPLITVINDDLMDNHQEELAIKLAEKGYSLFCNISSLISTLKSTSSRKFKPFVNDNDRKIALYVEQILFSDVE